MSIVRTYVRHGVGIVRPYLYGSTDLLGFVQEVFGAQELERAETEHGMHVEVQIGDAVVVLELGKTSDIQTRSSVYVYVEDVDATYQRALQNGGISVGEPTNKPYQERNAGVKDTSGNTWWIGTYTG